MPNQTQEVVDQIAEIVRRVGRRDEIETEIAENVNFSDLVAEQLKVEGPVRDMASKAVVAYLKNLEIESDSTWAEEIMEAIDFKKFVPSLIQSKDFQDVLSSAIENLVENGDLDLSSAVSEALDQKDLQKMLSTESMQETIAEKLKSYVDDFDMSNLGDDFLEKLDEVLFSKERIDACLTENSDVVDKLIIGKVEAYLEGDDYDENPITEAIGKSKTFQSAVDKAIAELVDSGKVTRLVEKVATDMLSGDESSLRDKLTQAISTQLVNRIAGGIVDRAFGR